MGVLETLCNCLSNYRNQFYKGLIKRARQLWLGVVIISIILFFIMAILFAPWLLLLYLCLCLILQIRSWVNEPFFKGL